MSTSSVVKSCSCSIPQGNYDDGIVHVHASSVTLKRKTLIHTDEACGAETFHTELEVDRGMPLQLNTRGLSILLMSLLLLYGQFYATLWSKCSYFTEYTQFLTETNSSSAIYDLISMVKTMMCK